MIRPLLALLVTGLLCLPARAEPLTRAGAMRIAEAYCNYHWHAGDKNILQGKDAEGVEVHTPNNAPGADPDPKLWNPGETNTGMPYK
jgi:hypothetical protein